MRKRMLIVGLIVGLLVFGSTALAFDLTQFGLQPAENYDFGGETVTIISWTSERMANYFNNNLLVMGRVQEAEQLFNCKIDFMQTREIPDTNFNRLLSGDSVNDLWHVQNKIGYWQLVANDALYPIYNILPESYYDAFPPSIKAVEEAFKYRGHYWGIGTVEYRPSFGYQNDLIFVAYNKTLIDRKACRILTNSTWLASGPGMQSPTSLWPRPGTSMVTEKSISGVSLTSVSGFGCVKRRRLDPCG